MVLARDLAVDRPWQIRRDRGNRSGAKYTQTRTRRFAAA